MNQIHIAKIKSFLIQLQASISQILKREEAYSICKLNKWRKKTGGGCSNTLTKSKIFEKIGVNFSYIYGKSIPNSAISNKIKLTEKKYQAMGLSIILHTYNPCIATNHVNIRFFFTEKYDKKYVWWFGGGYDLTPYYLIDKNLNQWHQEIFDTSYPFGYNIYLKFKKYCDLYFYLKHRSELRGIGGLFFDGINSINFEKNFSLIRSLGYNFIAACLPIIKKYFFLSYTKSQRDYQLYRRGRYVEFNMIWDRGTLFGLQSKGRTESILISIPPLVKWNYEWRIKQFFIKTQFINFFQTPKNWINIIKLI